MRRNLRICSVALLLSFHANGAPNSELRVNLFGQPCVLQGPVDARSLKAIHSLSPEQLYPERDVTLKSEPTRRAVDRLRGTMALPGLERYRERLMKRLDAQLILLESIEAYRKTKKLTPVLAAGKKFLTGRRLKDFEAMARKNELDSAFDTFSDGIESDPEEEFHRSIGRMRVQYTCSFDQSGAEPGSEKTAE